MRESLKPCSVKRQKKSPFVILVKHVLTGKFE